LKEWHISVYNLFPTCALFGAVQMTNVQHNVAVHGNKSLNIKTVYKECVRNTRHHQRCVICTNKINHENLRHKHLVCQHRQF